MDVVHKNFINRIELLGTIFKKLAFVISIVEIPELYLQLQKLQRSTSDLNSEYLLAVCPHLAKYYASMDRHRGCIDGFYAVFSSNGFESRNRDIVAQAQSICKNLQRSIKPHELEPSQVLQIKESIKTCLTLFGTLSLKPSIVARFSSLEEICECGAPMMQGDVSEYTCTNEFCKKIKSITPTIKTKTGGYDTSRHFKSWLGRILAIEEKTISPEILEKIKYVIERDNIYVPSLDYQMMRNILKDNAVQITTLNDHIPLLIKKIGGPTPPELSYDDRRRIEVLFNNVMEQYEKIITRLGNKTYYPYFIYKIVQILAIEHPHLKPILKFIHKQSADTLRKNDLNFKKICEQLNLPFIPTV